jgi:clathrin heavy chain
LQSEYQLCATTIIDGAKNVVQINPRNPSERTVNKMAAESVVPHPRRKILALKAGPNVQLFDLEVNVRLKSTKLNENVEFLRWIDERTLVLVCLTSVYHWSLEGFDILL